MFQYFFYTIKNAISDLILDITDIVKYELLGMEFKIIDYPIPKDIELKYSIRPDGVYAIAKDIPGLMFSSKRLEDLPEAFFDALLVYYDIPRYQANKMKPNTKITLHTGEILYASGEKENLKFA